MRLPIITERLVLRRLAMKDLPAIVRNMNDPDIVRDMDLIPSPFTRAHGIDWISSCIRQYGAQNIKCCVLAVTDRKNGRLIGEVGLNELDLPEKEGEIMYWLDRKYQGRGLMAGEVLPYFINWAFERFDINRITAGIFPSNKPSIEAAEKLGFRYEFSHPVLHRGKRRTERVYVLKKS